MARFTGTLEPGEFIIVQDVFKRLTQDACFRDDGDKKDWLGRFIINAYQGGITDNDRLYQHCLAASSTIAEAPSVFPSF
jgi:hypothetical protein